MKESQEEKQRRITYWGRPGSVINTQWGNLTYLSWLRREKERMARHEAVTCIVHNGLEVALAHK